MTSIARSTCPSTDHHALRRRAPAQAPARRAVRMRHAMAAIVASVAAIASLLGTGSALAQTFPSRPVTIVVPFAPGSPTDMAARAFAEDFGTALGTPVVVDNRPGAAQSIAGAFVARAPADGYTLLFANLPAIVPPSIQAKLPYVGIRDFAPIANVLSFGFVLFTSPQLPARNLQEFVALLKANPDKYSFGSGGVASPPHVIGEMFNSQIGVRTLHVPYKGANQVLLELVADRVSYAFLPTGGMEFVRAGKMKSFGVASEKRDVDFPELPTISEAGVSGFSARARFVLVAPKQTPPDVVTKLNAASNKVLAGSTFYPKVKSIGGVEVAPAA
ncbi:MAG: tripartite tricarboxylate transporter substrate binding protein, partial [Comamonadaceae bacterium]